MTKLHPSVDDAAAAEYWFSRVHAVLVDVLEWADDLDAPIPYTVRTPYGPCDCNPYLRDLCAPRLMGVCPDA